MQNSAKLSRGEPVDFLMMAVTAIVWASAFIAIKIAVVDTGPVWVAAWRVVIGFAVLLPYALWRGFIWPANRKVWLLIFVTGAVVAGYPAGVEYRFWPAPSGCGLAQAVDPLAIDDLLSAIDEPQAVPSCSSDPWQGRYGLYMAGWNMVMQIGLAFMSFRAAGVTFDRGPIPALAE